MNLPTVAECFHYFDEFGMLENIRAHSIMVARVAEALYDGLSQQVEAEYLPIKGEVIAGALLHDIAKTLCFGTKRRHGEEGAKICRELGYPEVAVSVSEHVLLTSFNEEEYRKGKFAAKEFVFYADKRVNHDQIVPLAEREEYIAARYGRGSQERLMRIHTNFDITRRLEACFFLHLPFSPEELADNLIPYTGRFGLEE